MGFRCIPTIYYDFFNIRICLSDMLPCNKPKCRIKRLGRVFDRDASPKYDRKFREKISVLNSNVEM